MRRHGTRDVPNNVNSLSFDKTIMETDIVDTIPLTSGLKLKIRDTSRKVAGDRWRVELVASIVVPVSQDWFTNTIVSPAPIDELKHAMGDCVEFEYKTTRNFIDEREKNAVFDQLKAGLYEHRKYYEHPDFAARLIVKKYAEMQKMQSRTTFSQ